jgi:hypothetical protein
MTPSKTLSLRLAPGLHDRLTAEAAAQGVTVSALAVRCLLLGLDLPPPPPPPDGALVAATLVLFADKAGNHVDLRRELAVELARLVEAGGVSAVGAARELRAVVEPIVAEHDQRWRELTEHYLATPVPYQPEEASP